MIAEVLRDAYCAVCRAPTPPPKRSDGTPFCSEACRHRGRRSLPPGTTLSGRAAPVRLADGHHQPAGLLTVRGTVMRPSGPKRRTYVVCDCDCGAQGVVILASSVAHEKTRSCGCLTSLTPKQLARFQARRLFAEHDARIAGWAPESSPSVGAA